MTEPAVGSLAAILATVTSVFTEAIKWVGTVGTTIVGNPLLMIGCCLPLIGVGVYLFKRLLKV